MQADQDRRHAEGGASQQPGGEDQPKIAAGSVGCRYFLATVLAGSKNMLPPYKEIARPRGRAICRDSWLAIEDAGSLAAVRLVAPERLQRVVLLAELHVLEVRPAALITIFARGTIVPSVIVAAEMAGAGHALLLYLAAANAAAVGVAAP